MFTLPAVRFFLYEEAPVVAIFHNEGEKKTAILQIQPKAVRATDGQVVELSGETTINDSASGLHKFFNSTLGTFQAGQIINVSTLQDIAFDISPQQELNRRLEGLECQKAEEAYQYAQLLGAGAQAVGQFYQYKQAVQSRPVSPSTIMPSTFHTTTCNSFGSTVTCSGN